MVRAPRTAHQPVCRGPERGLPERRLPGNDHYMRAAVAVSQSAADPLSGLEIQDVPEPATRDGWAKVKVLSSSLNMHDLWTLRGVGHPADRLPIVLGCDAAGLDEDGNPVVVYPVISDADAGR